ncbi:helix-turn-helix domain-containing protein [Streptomyces violascens]|uniref:helix-turn-helix domain-containing protein n=1 Tax=Streptomyces violascens TaxID=67381 RepID=UPI003676D912
MGVRSCPLPGGHGGQHGKNLMDESFGQALRRLRDTRSLRDVAHLANCGKSYVSDLEQDRKAPSPAMAAALDDALGADGELCALAATPPGASLSAQAAGPLDALAAGPLTAMSIEEAEYAVARHGRVTRCRAERATPRIDRHLADLSVSPTSRRWRSHGSRSDRRQR